MFDVTASCPIDEVWEDRQIHVVATAGRKYDVSEAGMLGNGPRRHQGGEIRYTWWVRSIKNAKSLQKRLRAIPGVTSVEFKEHTSGEEV